jgi:RNA polymerase sigma-70 factor (ECF subfamily)
MQQRELVDWARSGDREAFSDLARLTLDRQYAVAYLILRDVDRAQDAVQEALVSAWRDLRSLRDPDAWEAWLHRLTVRACYRLARNERRRTQVELRVVPDPDGSRPVDLALSLAERDRMERELILLPIDQRSVMVLHFYLDLPLTTVATILDIPVGTAKSRLHYGLRSLRRSMTDDTASARVLDLEQSA